MLILAALALVALVTVPPLAAQATVLTSAERALLDMANPFGLRMGTKPAALSKLGAQPAEGAGIYTLVRPPRPHPAFESYLAVASPTHGLCRVVAIGRDVQTGRNGFELRQAFDDLQSALTKKYGRHEAVDRLDGGSIWDEPEDYTMSILQKDRTVRSTWFVDDGARLPNDLNAISLEAKVSGPTEGYVVLTYEMSNFEQCSAEIRKGRDDPLE